MDGAATPLGAEVAILRCGVQHCGSGFCPKGARVYASNTYKPYTLDRTHGFCARARFCTPWVILYPVGFVPVGGFAPRGKLYTSEGTCTCHGIMAAAHPDAREVGGPAGETGTGPPLPPPGGTVPLGGRVGDPLPNAGPPCADFTRSGPLSRPFDLDATGTSGAEPRTAPAAVPGLARRVLRGPRRDLRE